MTTDSNNTIETYKNELFQTMLHPAFVKKCLAFLLNQQPDMTPEMWEDLKMHFVGNFAIEFVRKTRAAGERNPYFDASKPCPIAA